MNLKTFKKEKFRIKILKELKKRFRSTERIIPEKRRNRIKKELKNTGIDSETYLRTSTILIIIITAIITGLMIPKASYNSIGYGLISFSILYYLSLRIPGIIRSKYIHKLETSLTKSLRSIATELKIGIPFSIAIKHSSENNNEAGKELKKVIRDVEKGKSYPKAFSDMSRRNKSKFLKRAAKQLISAYSGDTEKGGEALKKLANEQETILKHEMEEYNEKLLFYSLIFIATSAIIPAMFQALVVVGSNFLDLGITPRQALIIPSIGFPILNTSLFIYIASKKP